MDAIIGEEIGQVELVQAPFYEQTYAQIYQLFSDEYDYFENRNAPNLASYDPELRMKAISIYVEVKELWTKMWGENEALLRMAGNVKFIENRNSDEYKRLVEIFGTQRATRWNFDNRQDWTPSLYNFKYHIIPNLLGMTCYEPAWSAIDIWNRAFHIDETLVYQYAEV